MLWVKSLHIVFMVTWFAGLFYLPRLFVYHALALGRSSGAEAERTAAERFKVMERKLYYGIMTPGAIATIAFGLWLWLGWFRGAGGWMHAKLALVVVLIGYHVWCGKLVHDFRHGRNRHGHVWYRWFNEFPVLILLVVVILVVVKPF
jgi:protoporphyrinogen IX oxidase